MSVLPACVSMYPAHVYLVPKEVMGLQVGLGIKPGSFSKNKCS